MKKIPWKYVIPALVALIALVLLANIGRSPTAQSETTAAPASTITASRVMGELVEWQISNQLVDPNLTALTLRIAGARQADLDNVQTMGIEIFGANPGRPLQVLSGLEAPPFNVQPHPFTNKFMTENKAMVVQDLNFDGFPDLRIMQSIGTNGNPTFVIWTYNTSLQQFVFQAEVAGLISPRADNQNKLLVSEERVDGKITLTTAYTFVGGKFVPTTRTTKTYTAENTYDLTVAKYNDDGGWTEIETQSGLTETPTPAP